MTGDMIVNLYRKSIWRTSQNHQINAIFPSDKERLLSFVKKEFPEEKGWLMEIEKGLCSPTPKVYVAINNGEIVGFACWDCSGLGYFGPFGVSSKYRNKGIGTELFTTCMDAMKFFGYGYSIIGWVTDEKDDLHSPIKFYEKLANAKYINDSSPINTIYSNKVTIKKYKL